jgi:hypothetical protein
MAGETYDIKATFDIRCEADGLREHLNMYVNVLKNNVQKMLKNQASLMCEDMLDYTIPWDGGMGNKNGRTLGAKKVGENSLGVDIDRLFAPLSIASYGDIARLGSYGIFVAYAQDRKDRGIPGPLGSGGLTGIGEWNKFQSTYSGEESFFDEKQTPHYEAAYGGNSAIAAAHNLMRGGSRVPNYKNNMKGKYDVFLVMDAHNKVESYKRKVEKRVGTLKAGWVTAGYAVNAARKFNAPAWIVGNQWGSGIMINELGNKSSPAISIGNKAHGKLTGGVGYTAWHYALQYRASAIRQTVNRALATKTPKTIQEATKWIEQSGQFTINENPF